MEFGSYVYLPLLVLVTLPLCEVWLCLRSNVKSAQLSPLYKTKFLEKTLGLGAGIAQSVQRLATGWTFRGSNPEGGGFSAPVQTGSEAYPASYTIGTGSFPGVKRPGRGVDHPPPSSA